MRRDKSTTPEDLDRPKGNSLKENYKLHDVGEREFVERCEELGFEVEPWGIDRRGDSGEDGVIYDDKMDFKVYAKVSKGVGVSDRELVALVDVKTKGSPRYMGRYNLRHHEHYKEHAEKHSVPTFVVMFQVDYKTDEVMDDFVFEILPGEKQVYTSKGSVAVSNFPDGNHAVLVPHEQRRGWAHFVSTVTRIL